MKDSNKIAPQRSEKLGLNLAIVGGGNACKSFLKLLQEELCSNLDIAVLGVCDIDPQAEGLCMAREMGIHTTSDFRDLCKLKNLDALVELTNRSDVLADLVRLKPKGVGILDHNFSRFLSLLCQAQKGVRNAEYQVAFEKGVSEFLIQQANERIVIVTPDFKIIEANGQYLKAVAKSKEEVVGAHCYEVTHGLTAPCASFYPELGCPLVETLRTNESAHVIHEHPTQNGHATYCDMVTYPLKNRSEEIVGIIEVWRDITRELSSRWEHRIKELKANMGKLIQEDRMISLGRLVASSVHEINNPIQGLLTFSRIMEQTLEQGQPGPEDLEEFRTYLPLMTSELERCGNIISGLLSFSRHSEVEYKSMDLNEVLKQVLTLSRHKMEIQNIHLDVALAPEPLIVEGDMNQLQQCFLNIIFNAIEAMPQGGRLLLGAALRPPGHLTLEVKDSGVGMNEEQLKRALKPFHSTKAKGLGIGLPLTRRIVERMGGRITLASRLGEGTVVRLTLPTVLA
jgi:signal transduction histidine kinase